MFTATVKKELPKYFAFGYPLIPRPYRWFVRKPFRIVWGTVWHYANPMTYYDTVKYFWQRGSRGYADCDWWNLNSYVASVNLGLLHNLREKAHGYPSGLNESDPLDEEDTDTNFLLWQQTLDKMILGFEAYIQMANDTECSPEACWGDPIGDVSCDEMIRQLNDPNRNGFNMGLYEEWRKPLQQQMDEGFALYAKYFHSLWD